MKNRIEIPLSKKKIALLALGSIAFVIGGTWIATNPESFIPSIFEITDPELIRIIGIAGIIFFALTGIYGVYKLFDKKVGLIIDSNGIIDNSNASSIGLIEWRDISEIRTKQVVSTKFILIDVINPEKYLAKAKNRLQANLMKANMNVYKTPLSITSNTLKYNFEELEKLVQIELERHKKTSL